MHATKKVVHGKYAMCSAYMYVQIQVNASVIHSLSNFSGNSFIVLKEKFQYIEEA